MLGEGRTVCGADRRTQPLGGELAEAGQGVHVPAQGLHLARAPVCRGQAQMEGIRLKVKHAHRWVAGSSPGPT